MSNTYTLTINEIHNLREKIREEIYKGNALERLHDNPDFRLIFLEEYLEKEPSRLVQLLGEPSFNTSKDKIALREDINERMIGIARFSEYMRFVFQKAECAMKDMENLNQAELDYNTQKD